MNQTEFTLQLASVFPETPERFSKHVDSVLENIIKQEKQTLTQKPSYCHTRTRTLAFVLVALLLLGSVALAAAHWGIFDALSRMLGPQPTAREAQLAKNLHTETINNVEINILEAGYDGRTLFIQYSYRLLDETEPFGIVDENGRFKEGLPFQASEKLDAHNVGWWIDHLWIDDRCVDMAACSGAIETGTTVPGEILRTEYWRLDHVDLFLNGQVTVALPIGKKQPLSEYSRLEHPERYNSEGTLLKPEKGLVSFSFDSGAVQEKITVFSPDAETVTPVVTAKVTEAAFSPLMSYITLSLKGSSEAMDAFVAANGEGWCDSEGNLLSPYTQADVHHSYIASLELVDRNGQPLFPGHAGLNGVGDTWAEFLYPSVTAIPEELWLAPVNSGVADMKMAVRVR